MAMVPSNKAYHELTDAQTASFEKRIHELLAQ